MLQDGTFEGVGVVDDGNGTVQVAFAVHIIFVRLYATFRTSIHSVAPGILKVNMDGHETGGVAIVDPEKTKLPVVRFKAFDKPVLDIVNNDILNNNVLMYEALEPCITRGDILS